jgi:predicted lipid-binding transport protein (Tim44 family)
MKKLLASLVIATTAMTTIVVDADARRLGGGSSVGRQSTNVSRTANQPATPMNSPAQAPMAAQRPGTPAAGAPAVKPPSPWKGILGGALLGLGLGALFSSLGLSAALGNAIGSILMIALLALAVVFIVRMFRRKDTPANAQFPAMGRHQPMPAGATPEIGSGLNQPAPFQPAGQPTAFQPVQQPGSTIYQPAHQPWGVPTDFDTASFLRSAKSSFIRMQAAWDKGDVADLREFTTPEVFGELRMQIQERGASADFTDVVSIDAELLGIETSGNEYLASVKFTGMIKPAPNALAEPFTEVWNMSKPVNGSSGWVLAGIQQLS